MTATTVAPLLPLLVATPLLAAGVTMFARAGSRWPVRLMLVTLAANLVAGIGLVSLTADGSAAGHRVGGWESGIAIPLVVDAFSALMVAVTGLLTLVCATFAVIAGTGRLHLFAPLILTLGAGVNGALLTADIFNLFVFIEVMLLPSYGLLVIARHRRGTIASVTGSRLYVTFNLFVSTIFLTGVALVYGTAGTVNLSELAGAAAQDTLVAAAAGLCLFALSMKAAVVPVHGWLARAYPSTSPAVTALFSGLHTKVAIYAIYRIYAVVFDGDSRYLWIGVIAFSATMLIGVLGAAGEGRMRSILAFHMVSQIGYILLGVALFTRAGLAAGIFYLLHHMIVKASLFLSAGAVEARQGTDELDRLRQTQIREPLLAVAFGIAALSLAGLPPFSGFLAKLTLIMAAIDAGQIAAAVVALVVSLITLLSMLKIFNAVFVPGLVATRSRANGTGAVQASAPVPRTAASDSAIATAPADARGTATRPAADSSPMRLVLPAAVLALVTLGLGLGGQLLLDLAGTAADGLLTTTTYVEAVTG